MADASAGRKARPLSPHLQIWRWTWAMRVSILHRVSGVGLGLFGTATLLCWLAALAGGEADYAKFTSWFGADLHSLSFASGFVLDSLIKLALRIMLVGLSWAFFNHFASGIRHFFLDIGAGFELKGNLVGSVVSPLLGILFTAAFWAAILLR